MDGDDKAMDDVANFIGSGPFRVAHAWLSELLNGFWIPMILRMLILEKDKASKEE